MSPVALSALMLAALGATPVVVIEHQPPLVEQGALEARLASTSGRRIFEPAAFVRAVGATEFARLPLTEREAGAGVFRADLPESLKGIEIEYFLEAFDEDGNGPFRKGSPERPLRLTRPPPPPRSLPAAATAAEQQALSRPRRTAGITLLASGAALLVGGGICGALALKDYSTEKAATELGEYEKAKSAAKTEGLVADVLFGAGIAAATVGAVLWLTDPSTPSGPAVSLGASATRGGAVAVLSGRF